MAVDSNANPKHFHHRLHLACAQQVSNHRELLSLCYHNVHESVLPQFQADQQGQNRLFQESCFL